MRTARIRTRGSSTTCSSGRTASSSRSGRRSSRRTGRSGFRSAPGTRANRRPRAAGGLDRPPRRDLCADRRRPHADLRDHARGQLRPRRVPHARDVRRLLGVRFRRAGPVSRPARGHPALLRGRPSDVRAGHAGRHSCLPQRPDLHDRRAVHRAAERRARRLDGGLPHAAAVALLGRDPRARHGVQSLPGGRVRHRRRPHARPLRLHEVDPFRPGHARHRAGPRRRDADGHRHRPRLPPDVRDRDRVRGRRGRTGVAALRRLPHGRAPVRPPRLCRRRARGSRRHGGGDAGEPDRGGGGGPRIVRLRRGLEGSLLLRPVHRRARLPPGRALRPARRRDARGVMASFPPRRWAALALLGVATLLPLVVRDAFVLDSLILILMWGALSAAWNVAGGYAGQVSLGHVAWVYVALGVALIYYGVEAWLESSRLGYQLAGVREDEDAAEALGIASRRLKIHAVTLSAAMTSVGGTLWAQYVGFVDPFYVFSIDLSIRFALNTIIGGMGTALGPFLGSILITSLETYLRATFSGLKTGFAGTYLVIYGTALILVVRFAPEGLTGLADRLGAWRARADA